MRVGIATDHGGFGLKEELVVSAEIKQRQFSRFWRCQDRRWRPAGTRRRQPPVPMPAAMVRVYSLPARASGHGRSSRAVSRSRSCGTPAVFGVWLDRLDYQVEFVGAVDLPEYAVVLARCGRVGFGEVMQAINTACRVIPHQQDNTGAVFRPREQKQMIGAEVEHRRGPESGSRSSRAHWQRR
jgi:hypothetical protein